VGSDEAQKFIEKEIAGERAGAMARAVEALERALRDLRSAGAATRELVLEEARERLWFVVVQREAVGLTRHEVLYEVLRVPAEVRRAMGPARRSP
jgi:hypothetical protein